VPDRRREIEQHFVLRHSVAPRLALPHRQKRRCDRVSESSAAEVHPHPQRARLVREDVDVVIAAPDRAELLACLDVQRLAVLRRHRVPGGVLEQRVIDRRVIGAIAATHAEAHRVRHGVGDGAQRPMDFIRRAAERVERQVRADRRVPARDVEPDADDGDEVAIRRYAADRHHVSHVPIGHQRGVDGTLAHAVELEDRLLVVLAEDLHGRGFSAHSPSSNR
jgi:hypothetical protein